ncbi:YunG family protein [Sutcliffiella rhizosphaerae]|uniref:Uncharacterized protein n=1 Tax=Sutcliffiella rhizosphaerae TaxID=2880967 RepID=A0ABN8A4Y5_9BACI|nr:hypothetical protein [Sutcliffiella rhizosphaerae]CAG9620176.1 hypothetical protein BACCIP111883_00944 [Sutcliffiella rhizosphaerae]
MKPNIKSEVDILHQAFVKSWSIESSSKWQHDNPAKGQCGVTALVANDKLGGEIKKTKLKEGWHFYNVLNGKRHDFTVSQFKEEIVYMDMPSNREEAFADTNTIQYDYLRNSVTNFMEIGG